MLVVVMVLVISISVSGFVEVSYPTAFTVLYAGLKMRAEEV